MDTTTEPQHHLLKKNKNYGSPGSTLGWRSKSGCDIGRKRSVNEDAVLEKPNAGIWVVADGMGGHTAGGYASQFIVSVLNDMERDEDFCKYIEGVEYRLQEINRYIFHESHKKRIDLSIGSTVIVMLTYQDICFVLWAGDSRLYRIRKNVIAQLTTDHSQVEQYVQNGAISREEAFTHPHSNIITRAVGVSSDFFLDMDIYRMEEGDIYLLCSDGLNKHLKDEEILENIIATDHNIESACRQLVDSSLDRGGYDNISVILVEIVRHE